VNKFLVLSSIISLTTTIIVSSSLPPARIKIRGLVLPHHDLAKELIIRSVRKLATIDPGIKTIIILSPNHYRPDSPTFTTADKLRDFAIDTDRINKIKTKFPRLAVDDQLLENEHGLYVPMGFLRQFFPQATFVPMAISPHFDNGRLREMAEILETSASAETLWVASTDFSHEHTINDAAIYDKETIQTIANFDYAKLEQYTDDHLDSPAAMMTVMYAVQEAGGKNWKTWYESHGAIILGKNDLVGTSYVSGIFFSGKP
jgi:AmmeMemoRadiSam system protein B